MRVGDADAGRQRRSTSRSRPVYTFNAVDATEKWRRAYLAKLGAAVAAA